MKNKRLTIILLLVLICFHLSVNILWHNSNELLQGKATFEHFNKTVNMLRIFNHDFQPYFYNFDKSYLYNIIYLSFNLPSLYHCHAALSYKFFYSLFGYKAIYIASSLFFVILIVFTYKIGNICFNNTVGIFSAFFCSFIPFNFFVSRQLNLEMAVSAFITASFYFIIKSQHFLHKKHSIIAGILAGISLLFKNTASILILGYLLWFTVEFRYCIQEKNHSNTKKRRRNVILFIFFLVITASIYYGHPAALKSFLNRAVNLNIFPNLIHRIDCYGKGLLRDALGMILGIIFILASFFAFKEKKLRDILIFWILIPFISIVFFPKNIPDEQLEFLIPLLPAVAVISATIILSIKNTLFKNSIILILTVFMPFQFLICSFYPQIKSNGDIRTRYDNQLFLLGYGCPPIGGGHSKRSVTIYQL